jgi:hypothetical protein
MEPESLTTHQNGLLHYSDTVQLPVKTEPGIIKKFFPCKKVFSQDLNRDSVNIE